MPHPDPTARCRTRPLRCAIAVTLALASLAAVAQGNTPPAGSHAAATTRTWDIPAGPLGDTLARIARETGQRLSADPALIAGRTAAPVRGNHTPANAAHQALAGSGLELIVTESGTLTVRPAPPRVKDGETTLAPVTVRAEAERESAWGPVKGYVAKRSATATKTDTAIIETPQSISVIGRDEMESHGHLSVREALRYTPGVQVELYGADDRPYENPKIRGMDPTSYLDGLRMPTSSSLWTYGISESYGLERIETLRGPSSVLYGQGDAGGMVNRVSKRPQREATSEIDIKLGTRNLRQIGIDIGGSTNEEGTIFWRLVGVGHERESQIEVPGQQTPLTRRQYFAPSITWFATPSTSITFLGSYLHHESIGNNFEYVDNKGRRTGVLVDDPSYSHFENKKWGIGYALEHIFASGWKFQQDLRTGAIGIPEHTSLTAYDFADASGNLERTNVLVDEAMRYTVLDTRFLGTINAASAAHRLLFGVDLMRAKTNILNIYSANAPGLNVYNPVYGARVARPSRDEAYLDQTETQHQLGIYAQDQIRFDSGWLVTLGGRYDVARGEQDNHQTGLTTKTDDMAFTGRAGLSYQTSMGLAPYISYSESFLPTAGTTVGGEAFKPTRGRQYELGVKFQPSNHQMLLTAAVYDLAKTNVVTYDPITFAGEQRGEVTARGLELEAKMSLTRGLDMSAQYTLNDIKTTRDNDSSLVGKRPQDVAKHMASIWFDYTVRDGEWTGLGIGVGARYRGARYGNTTNTLKNDAMTAFDATVHYSTGSWRIALNGTNLFDRDQGSYAYGTYWPSVKRSITASATYRF